MRFVAISDDIPKGRTVSWSTVHDLKVNDLNIIAKQQIGKKKKKAQKKTRKQAYGFFDICLNVSVHVA